MKANKPWLLAIAPVSRGFGYVVMDTKGALLDSRVKEIRDREHKNARCIAEVDKLLAQFKPDVIVIEDHRAQGARRRGRVPELLDLLAECASDSGAVASRYGLGEVREHLGLPIDASKDKIAAAVAKRLPMLERRIPKIRHIWDSERYGMAIFTAAAFALLHQSGAQRMVHRQ